MKTIIIGLGNPFLTDDSVGIKVARQLDALLRTREDIDVTELYAGGIRLLDAMTGYDRAIIIDAIITKENKPGTIHRLTMDDLIQTWNTISVHDMNLTTALAMGTMLEIAVPSTIDIWGIEGADLESFSETLTREVADSVSVVVNAIIHECDAPCTQLVGV